MEYSSLRGASGAAIVRVVVGWSSVFVNSWLEMEGGSHLHGMSSSSMPNIPSGLVVDNRGLRGYWF